MAAGLLLLTNLHADTDRPILWLWMIVAGLGIGPSFAVFALVVQNAVRPVEIGVATSSLTFFQQIGGTVGLTIAQTLFTARLLAEIPVQLARQGLPQEFISGFRPTAALDINGVGDLGQRILASVPAEARAALEPLIPAIVAGIHEAASLALGSTFWVGIVGALIGLVAVLFLRETPMRTTFEMAEPQAAAAEV